MVSVVKHRDYSWDVLKSFLIVLVILGHWLEYGLKNGTNLISYNFIYLFHMPLFILISGLFSSKKDKYQFRKSIMSLIETYIVVQVLYVLTSFFLQHKPFTWQQLYTPNAAAWYLLSLISWRSIIQVIPDRFLYSNCFFAVSILLSLMVGFLPFENELSIQRTIAFLPFFLCGFLFKEKIRIGSESIIKKIVCCSLLFFIFIGCCFGLNRDVSFVTYCNTNYYTPPHPVWVLLLFRALYSVVASIMIYAIITLFPIINHSSFVSHLGEDTLFYYVYHIIILRMCIIIIRYYNLPLSFPAILLYSIISLVVLYFMGKIKIFRWVLTPISIH